MFSLHVGLTEGEVPAGRMFEYTDDTVKQTFLSDPAGLLRLSVLSMPEIGRDPRDQIARIGKVVALRTVGRDHRFTFVPDPSLGQYSMSTIQKLASKLGIGDWELRRTHWAVKEIDLFEVLLQYQLAQSRISPGNFSASGAIQFPTDLPRDPGLIAVMMPFSKDFDIVYETIELAAADAGLRCLRADDIWEHDHVMSDVLSLIWRASIVVADLTDKNTNVFYETGLAHALPRRTVLLTQEQSDIPFDLRAIRFLQYGLSAAERSVLRKQLTDRFNTLAKDQLS